MFDLNSLDPAKVTYKPYASPGARFRDCQIIPLDKIYVQAQENNPVRVVTKNEDHIKKLMGNFQNGINYSQMPPVVMEKPRQENGKHYTHELVCGHHRYDAMTELGYDRWVFWVYDFAQNGYTLDDSIRTFQIRENDHIAALASSLEDVVKIVLHLLQNNSKLVENNEDSIRNFVNTYCLNMRTQTRNKVVSQVMAKAGTYRQVVTYTSNDAYQWVRDNTDYAYGGELDSKRKKFGWTVLEGYEYEFIMSAVKKFRESGKPSYFICRTKAPTVNHDLDTKRQKMMETFQNLEDSLVEVFEYYQKYKKFPWSVEGFMPQDQSNEDTKSIIRVK